MWWRVRYVIARAFPFWDTPRDEIFPCGRPLTRREMDQTSERHGYPSPRERKVRGAK